MGETTCGQRNKSFRERVCMDGLKNQKIDLIWEGHRIDGGRESNKPRGGPGHGGCKSFQPVVL
jgi:hypothetical protein